MLKQSFTSFSTGLMRKIRQTVNVPEEVVSVAGCHSYHMQHNVTYVKYQESFLKAMLGLRLLTSQRVRPDFSINQTKSQFFQWQCAHCSMIVGHRQQTVVTACCRAIFFYFLLLLSCVSVNARYPSKIMCNDIICVHMLCKLFKFFWKSLSVCICTQNSRL